MAEKNTPWIPSHLSALAHGGTRIPGWRASNPDTRLELSSAPLMHALLRDADLRDANLKHAELTYADLRGANLHGAVLADADLSNANLSRAVLSGADLTGADLSGADLHGASLSGTKLRWAKLIDADLEGTNLNRCDLVSADLANANLMGAKLTNAAVGKTRFSTDLGGAIDLDTLHHEYPSPITIDSLIRSRNGVLPIRFLRGIGLTDTEIDFARAIAETPIQFYPVFISYTAHDADDRFAVKLEAALQAKGVRCWFDKKALYPRDDILEKINQAIRDYDVLLLVCSRQSLTSYWVEDEVERIIEKERKLVKSHGKLDLVMPIDLDGYLFSDECDFKFATNLRGRKAARLTGWEDDPAIFDKQLEDIVKGLRSDDLARLPAPESKLKPREQPGE